MQEVILAKAKELLQNSTVNRVLGWKTGEFAYDVTPAVFGTAEALGHGVGANALCGNNQSK